MSFSNNCKSDKIPGPIKANPLNGICDKVCIEANKVIDMCMRQEVVQDITLTLTDITPTTAVAPFTFLSAKSVSEQANVENLAITEFQDGSCNCRISCDISIPIQVFFLDANNNQASAMASITVPKDVVLHTSAPSIMPYEIKASAAFISSQGTYSGENSFTLTGCLTTILKVVMPVHLLIPSYGYCYIPPCVEYTQDACEGLFDIPLYPQECGVESRCSSRLK